MPANLTTSSHGVAFFKMAPLEELTTLLALLLSVSLCVGTTSVESSQIPIVHGTEERMVVNPTSNTLTRHQCSATCFVYAGHVITCGDDVTALDLQACYQATSVKAAVVLDLTNCHLPKIDRPTFSGMSGIKDLYLDGASFDLISSDAFMDLTALTFVSLKELAIPVKAIVPSLLHAPSLRRVALAGNAASCDCVWWQALSPLLLANYEIVDVKELTPCDIESVKLCDTAMEMEIARQNIHIETTEGSTTPKRTTPPSWNHRDPYPFTGPWWRTLSGILFITSASALGVFIWCISLRFLIRACCPGCKKTKGDGSKIPQTNQQNNNNTTDLEMEDLTNYSIVSAADKNNSNSASSKVDRRCCCVPGNKSKQSLGDEEISDPETEDLANFSD